MLPKLKMKINLNLKFQFLASFSTKSNARSSTALMDSVTLAGLGEEYQQVHE